MNMERFEGRIIWDIEGWFTALDRNPISPGHTLLFTKGQGTDSVPSGLEEARQRATELLRGYFADGVPESCPGLRRAFPSATGRLERILFYRLGDAESEFHVHLVPYFGGQRAEAASFLRLRTHGALEKGGLLAYLGQLEATKDAREALGLGDRIEELDLASLARAIQQTPLSDAPEPE